jgi:CBS domain containing-hemolysin-like protein
MCPIDEMISLKADDTVNVVLNLIMEHRYSRYPIFYGKTKEIIERYTLRN